MSAMCDAALSAVVDHVVPAGVVIAQAKDSGLYLTDRYAGFYFMSNLQGLCRNCHGIKTLQDKAHVSQWRDAVEVERNAPKRRFTF